MRTSLLSLSRYQNIVQLYMYNLYTPPDPKIFKVCSVCWWSLKKSVMCGNRKKKLMYKWYLFESLKDSMESKSNKSSYSDASWDCEIELWSIAMEGVLEWMNYGSSMKCEILDLFCGCNLRRHQKINVYTEYNGMKVRGPILWKVTQY